MTKMTIIPQGKGPLKEGALPKDILLHNEGELDLTFIGAGSAFSKKFFQNNLLVVKGDTNILIDCGTRCPEALSKHGLSVADIGTYLITHSHADHIGGLEEVMLLNRYMAHRRPRIIINEHYRKTLWSMSLRGGASFNEVHDGIPLGFEDFWETVTPERVRGMDREFASVQEGAIEVGIFRTKHIPDSALGWEDSFTSYGVILDRRALFTSDTRFDPEMIIELDAKFGLETIFHDCQFYKGGVHASLDELATLPEAIKAKTQLMHYGDGVDNFRERAKDAGFAGFVQEGAIYRFPAREGSSETKPD